MDREFGIVRKKFDTFLFIMDKDGQDRFAHYSNLSKKSVKPFHHLQIGDKVSFVPAINTEENKPTADELEFIPVERKGNTNGSRP